eukprot:10906268-Prorocentrum_lima.AAC.1
MQDHPKPAGSWPNNWLASAQALLCARRNATTPVEPVATESSHFSNKPPPGTAQQELEPKWLRI